MKLQRFVIFTAAMFFLLYGAAFSLVPSTMSSFVTGSVPQGASALVDFRATYGGMTCAIGAALLYLYAKQQLRESLVIVIFVLACMAITRTVGLFEEGGGNTFMYLYLFLEILGSALALYAMKERSGSY